MEKITVILRDEGNHGYEPVLVYTVDVPEGFAKDAAKRGAFEPDEASKELVRQAVIAERIKDIGELDDDEGGVDPDEVEILLCFAGNVPVLIDWRE